MLIAQQRIPNCLIRLYLLVLIFCLFVIKHMNPFGCVLCPCTTLHIGYRLINTKSLKVWLCLLPSNTYRLKLIKIDTGELRFGYVYCLAANTVLNVSQLIQMN